MATGKPKPIPSLGKLPSKQQLAKTMEKQSAAKQAKRDKIMSRTPAKKVTESQLWGPATKVRRKAK